MSYLLDTCVLSEFTRRQPLPEIIQWVDSIEEQKLFISVVTIGEIQHGVEGLPASRRKNELLVWMNDGLIQRFGERILPLETSTLLLWGSLIARLESAGQPMGVMDSLIAATALQHNLIIATRNVNDYLPCGARMINPWD